ncbi:MAG: hypothetical protein IKO03_02500 [Lachnospiraceae bacterium]|nr:hypothetical protein [Lachnospiraceae bacterium]MBR4607305.1 hypothetical protein [Lachnospiraceae bacterium]
MKTSLKLRDYHQYEFSKREWIVVLTQAVGILLFFSWFFYRSLLAVLPLAPLGWLWVRYVKKQKGEKRRQELTEQFKECILSVSASLQAGYAVENAFLESREDMRSLYGEDSMIYEELEILRRGLVINVALEELLLDFGVRSGCEEILQFGQMFSIAKRGGGSLSEMIRASANLISQRIEARQEVQTMLAGRRMEQNVMRLMPFGITAYISVTYSEYFQPLYHDLSGVGIMTLCLVLYLLALLLGEKIFQNIWSQMEGQERKEKLAAMAQTGILGKMARLGRRTYTFLRAHRLCPYGGEKLRKHLEILYPEENREELLEKYYGGKMGLSFLILLLGFFFSLCLLLKGGSEGQEQLPLTILGMSVASSVGVFFLMDKDLEDQVKKRREWLRLGYPDLVHGLALYLVSGMTIRAAFGRLGKSNELAAYAFREMQAGVSEQTAYEHFGKRAGPREYVKLSTLLCQNLKKGSSTLLSRLEEEAIMAADGRIQSGKRLGEEAETKLLIPMVMLLSMVMLMIMIPAFSMMGA